MTQTRKTAAETAWIVEAARELGFELCGVVSVESVPESAKWKEWLERGYAGEMKYLSDPRREHLREAMFGAKSAIVCGLNYNVARPYSTEVQSSDDESDAPRGWISRYAWGSDYHEVMWGKLNALVAAMREKFAGEEFEAKAWADTGPVQERVLARYAGLGWIGKNTLLLNQKMGSWLFLGTILTDLELMPTVDGVGNLPMDLCGSCTRCIDACPTDALVEPYVMDARRCIAYLTIELRGAIPEELREGMGSHVFGCDICQDVCPWNRKSPRTEAEEFQPRKIGERSLFAPELEWLAGMSEEEFRGVFRGSAIKRTKWRGMVRNACIALGNSGLSRDSEYVDRVFAVLERLAGNENSIVAESARWALERLKAQTKG